MALLLTAHLQVVLDGCSTQQQPVAAPKGQQHTPAATAAGLYGLGLIQNHELPLDLLQHSLVSNCHLVAGQAYVERRSAAVQPAGRQQAPQRLAVGHGTPVRQDLLTAMYALCCDCMLESVSGAV